MKITENNNYPSFFKCFFFKIKNGIFPCLLDYHKLFKNFIPLRKYLEHHTDFIISAY